MSPGRTLGKLAGAWMLVEAIAALPSPSLSHQPLIAASVFLFALLIQVA